MKEGIGGTQSSKDGKVLKKEELKSEDQKEKT